MTDARLRWIKFWPQDWHGSKELRTCSLAARGLWIDLLCIAHDGEPYGHVTLNGRPANMRQIASIAGVPEKEAARLVAELEDAGVFSRSDEGAIYSRRMVRDMAKRIQGQQDGKGGGNPNLVHPDKPQRTEGLTGGVNPHSNPQEARGTEARKEGSLRSLTREPDGFDQWWAEYPRKDAKGAARKAYAAALKKATEAELLTGVRLYPFQPDPQYQPMPATWLNQERWATAGTAPAAVGKPEGKLDWLEKYMGAA